MLRVRTPPTVAQKPMTISPFLLHPLGGGGDDSSRRYSTESGYATIHDLTSSQGNEDDLFTRTWEPIDPETLPQNPALPTKKPITTTTMTGQHRGSHQQHHHHDHSPHVQQMEHDMKHKLFYINTTNFDGSPDLRHHNRTKTGLVHLDLNPPPTPPPYYTTEDASRRMPTIYYAATPPSFPPPRTTSAMVPVHQHPPPAYPHNIHQQQQYPPHYPPPQPAGGYQYTTHDNYRVAPGGGGVQTQYPIQTMQPSYYPPQYPQQPPQQPQFNTMVTFTAHTPSGNAPAAPPPVQTTTTQYQIPFQQYNQMPSPPQSQPPQYITPASSGGGGSIVATSPPLFASSSTQVLQPFGIGYGGGMMISPITSVPSISNQEKSKAKGEPHYFSFYR